MSDGMVYIEDTGKALDRANKLLASINNGEALHKAIGSAAYRAARSARAKAGSYVAQQYTIGAGGFKSHVKDKIVTTGGAGTGGVTSVQIQFAGTVIPLIEFKLSYSNEGSVNATVKKGGGGALPSAFVKRVYGHFGVWERETNKRYPVEEKYGPSAAHMMMEDTVVERMDKQITETFEKRLEHEINRILNGWGG